MQASSSKQAVSKELAYSYIKKTSSKNSSKARIFLASPAGIYTAFGRVFSFLIDITTTCQQALYRFAQQQSVFPLSMILILIQ